MTYNKSTKIFGIIIFVAIALLSGCQSQPYTSDLQNASYIGLEEDSVQVTYSEPKQFETSSVQSTSNSGIEQGSIQSEHSEPEKSEGNTTQNTVTLGDTEQSQDTHTDSESPESGNNQNMPSSTTEQGAAPNTQTTSERVVSSNNTVSETVPELSTSTTSEINPTESTEEKNLNAEEIYIKVGQNTLTVFPEDNESVKALKELLTEKPLTISASNYGGFEKVCSLGTTLPRNDSQTTTHAGDICLYNGNQIVIFYGSNSWSYTRLGKISNADNSELEKILSGDDTEITLSLKPFD